MSCGDLSLHRDLRQLAACGNITSFRNEEGEEEGQLVPQDTRPRFNFSNHFVTEKVPKSFTVLLVTIMFMFL
jgi:hypothetical protein